MLISLFSRGRFSYLCNCVDHPEVCNQHDIRIRNFRMCCHMPDDRGRCRCTRHCLTNYVTKITFKTHED